MTRVSVIVPAFNLARFLPRALESALVQTHPAHEIVVVDDGSTDETPQVLAGYADRVRVIRQDNRGLVGAVARGLTAAEGDLVALLDADDEWPADRLERHVAFLHAHPRVGLVHGDLEVIDDHGTVTAPSYFAEHRLSPPDGRVLGALIGGNFVTQSALTFRAVLLPAVAPMPAAAVYADWWIAAAVAAVAEIAVCPGTAARYRRHGANMNLGADVAKVARREVHWRRFLLGAFAADDTVAFEHLLPAWRGFEHCLHAAAAAAPGTARRLLAPEPPAADLAAAGADRLAAGDADGAARLLLQALAADPWDGAARLDLTLALQACPPVPRVAAAPVAALALRRDVTLAAATDLLAAPDLLRDHAARTTGADDATLLILVDPAGHELPALAALVEALGLDHEDAADMLAQPAPATLPARRLLAARAGRVLSPALEVAG